MTNDRRRTATRRVLSVMIVAVFAVLGTASASARSFGPDSACTRTSDHVSA